MLRQGTGRIGSAAALLVALASSGAARADEPVRSLFNGEDLSGWVVTIDPNPESYSPEARPDRVFRVEDGMIHVSGERYGCLSTNREFANYRLLVEFRWGDRRWPPRADVKRDSGILVHASGPDKFWTKSIECQIQEGDTGDFWLVDGTSLIVDGEVQTNYKEKSEDAENPTGEWNTVEVICDGDTVTNIVNGKVVNHGTEASERLGRITLQSEGAEIFFRKVEIRPLK